MLNLDDYIKSGILEEYAMGLLPEEAAADVFRMAQLHPRVREELDKIERTLFILSNTCGIPPSPGLGALIEAKIISQGAPRQRPLPGPNIRLRSILPAAICFVALLVVLHLYLSERQQVQHLVEHYEQVELLKLQNEELVRQLKAANNYRTERTRLFHAQNESQYALVYAEKDELLVCTTYMPAPPAGSQYQLWSIVKGAPESSGVIPLRSNGAMSMLRRIPEAASYAISIEPVGGSAVPTIDKIIASGGIEKQNF